MKRHFNAGSTRILLRICLLCFFGFCGAASLVNHTDVLRDLYDGLNGAEWKPSCAWDMRSGNYCEWNAASIVCDRLTPGEIFEIRLEDCGANGTIPASFGRLTHLQRLRLNSKHEENGSPVMDPSRRIDFSKVGNFTGSQLRILSLDRTDFGPTIPACFQGMTEVNTLVLSRSALKGDRVLDDLMHMKKMRLFHVYDNQIAGTIPTEIGQLSVLAVLNLFNNRIEGEIPSQLGKLTSMELFSANRNNLRGSIPSQIGELSELAQLRLGKNPALGGELPKTLGKLSNLLFLRLEDASFAGKVPAELRYMSSLQSMDLSNNQLTSIPVQEWSMLIESLSWTVPAPHKCENVTYDLRKHRNPRFRNIYLEELPSPYLQNLASIDLSMNKINMEADDIIRALSGLMSLVSIDVSHNELHGQNQLEYLINDAFVFGSPRLMVADFDLPCEKQRVDFAWYNQRKILQIVTDLNLAGNPNIQAHNMSHRIAFSDRNMKEFNISGNTGITGELWRNAFKLETFDATGAGFTSMPPNTQVDVSREIVGRTDVTCYAYQWVLEAARDHSILVDADMEGFRSCFCNPNFESNMAKTQCQPCPQGQVTSTTDFLAGKNHTCEKCSPGSFRGYSESGEALCLQCPNGQFQEFAGENSCSNCPAGSMPNTNKTSCHAMSGYWKWDSDGLSGSMTDPAAEQDLFMKCFAIVDENGATACTGANSSNIDKETETTNFTDAGCIAGTDSTLCLSCTPGYTKLQSFNPFSPCVPCDATQILVSSLMVVAIVIIIIGVVVVAIYAQEHRLRYRRLLIASGNAPSSARFISPVNPASGSPHAAGSLLKSPSVRFEESQHERVVELRRQTTAELEEGSEVRVPVSSRNVSTSPPTNSGQFSVSYPPDERKRIPNEITGQSEDPETEPSPEQGTVEVIPTDSYKPELRAKVSSAGASEEIPTMGRPISGADVIPPESGDTREIPEPVSASALRSTFKVILSYFQITSSIALLPLPWSLDELWLFRLADSVGISSFNLDCLLGNTNADARLHLTRAVFTLVMVPLAIILSVLFLALWEKVFAGKWCTPRVTQRQVVATTALAITAHYLCARSGLELLSCLEHDAAEERFPGGASFLRLDPQFECPTTSQSGLEIGLAVALLVIYGCGIPLVSFWAIRRDFRGRWSSQGSGREEGDRGLRRKLSSVDYDRLNGDGVERRFQYLYEDYKPGFWHWELVILLRKSLFLAVTMLLKTPEGEVEIACAQMVLFAATLLQAVCMPFELDFVNRLDIAGLIVSMVTIFVGIMLRRDNISAEQITIATVATGILNLFFVFVAVSTLCYHAKQRITRARRLGHKMARRGSQSASRSQEAASHTDGASLVEIPATQQDNRLAEA